MFAFKWLPSNSHTDCHKQFKPTLSICICYWKEKKMATGPRPWLITFCITLIYVKRTCPKIVEGTIDTKEVSPLNDKIGVLWNLKLNSRLERARSSDRGVSLIAPFSFEFF